MRNALLVGTNQSKYLIWGALAEAITNIVLDYGLIYGRLGLPEIGFNGAAYASIVAEASGLLVIFLSSGSWGCIENLLFLNTSISVWS